ncbi:hypothetical protein NQ317_019898 [Molorchus minor]|uniref:PHD-type domain-containing protein n=1 Tax=Molorchus minor TaxID=1323400 RepID=A0ABQ9J8U2_9CUCU|nr:hypothetical protein NQ317_019898 [Molorchus minor]
MLACAGLISMLRVLELHYMWFIAAAFMFIVHRGEGFLSEAHSEEVDQADPFYAHCKLHSDKTLVKKRKKNYLSLQLRIHYRKLQFEQDGHSDTPEQLRIQRKMEKQRVHYLNHKSLKPLPWEMQEAQAAALVDVRKKWHIPPAFTVEFIAYYLDRNDRLKDMKNTLEKLMDDNKVLLDEQQGLRVKYDEVLKKHTEVSSKNIDLKQTIHKYHSAILSACPTKNLPNIDDLGKPPVARAPQPMMVPTAAALKMGVGFPLKNIPTGRGDRVLSSHATKDPLMLNECGICRQRRDQHLLTKCDTCHLFYHLNCLNPPLSRFPKKSKLYGWQCSECDKTSDSEVEEIKTPRRSRSRYSRENKSDPEDSSPPIIKIKPVDLVETKSPPSNPLLHVILDNGIEAHKSAKKRRREKHRNRYSPELGISSKEHKRKRKKKSLDIEESLPHPRITIKVWELIQINFCLALFLIKPIPLPAGEVPSASNPQRFYVPNEADDNAPPPLTLKAAKIGPRDVRKSRSPRVSEGGKGEEKVKALAKRPSMLNYTCDVCQMGGTNTDSVKCDDCQKNYHFTCLDPPVKKTRKEGDTLGIVPTVIPR